MGPKRKKRKTLATPTTLPIHIPSHFPPFPEGHTFRSTPVSCSAFLSNLEDIC